MCQTTILQWERNSSDLAEFQSNVVQVENKIHRRFVIEMFPWRMPKSPLLVNNPKESHGLKLPFLNNSLHLHTGYNVSGICNIVDLNK